MSTPLPYVHKSLSDTHTHSVIWLHGLGADGHDFESIVDEMDLPNDCGIHFIFPHADVRPITFNGGMAMRGWYDIKGVNLSDREDEEGIEHSRTQIVQLIEAEHQKGIPYNRIFIAGFSQGGAMALYTGLTFEHTLAGVIALSCYLPIRERFKFTYTQASLATPILQAHGEFDPIVQEAWGKQSCDILTELGYTIEYQCYPMAHQVCDAEIQLIQQWLLRYGTIALS